MALKVLPHIDLDDLFVLGVYDLGSGGSAYRMFNVGQQASSTGVAPAYWDQRDLIIHVGGTASPPDRHTTFDPNFVASAAPKASLTSVTAGVAFGWMMGEWNRLTGATQNIYTWNGVGSGEPLNDFDISSLQITSNESFPGVGLETDASGTIGSGVIGYHDLASRSGRVFETWGYMVRYARVRHLDGSQYTGLALIDLTGDNPALESQAGTPGTATLLPGVSTSYSASPSNPTDTTVEQPEFNGSSFELTRLQFVPDEDDTPNQPKGRLFLTSDLGTQDGTDVDLYWHYLSVVEFNPFSKTAAPGSPSRIHLRNTLLTRMEYRAEEAPGTNENSIGVDALVTPPAELAGHTPLFHPPSRSFRTMFDWTASNGTTLQDRVVVSHSLTPAVSQISAPTALTDVETNRTVTFGVHVTGSIAEAVPGKTVDWSIQRGSTVREVLDTAVTPSGPPVTSQLDQFPVDANSLVVEFTDDGGLTYVELQEGAIYDYTIDEATGEITWGDLQVMASPPGPAATGYVASYAHRTDPASPAHGTLLLAASSTDEEGRAVTRVRYPDNALLAGDFDILTASVED